MPIFRKDRAQNVKSENGGRSLKGARALCRRSGQEPGPGPGPHCTTETHQGTFAIQIITKPEGANLYVGTTYRGPGGATLEEPLDAYADSIVALGSNRAGQVYLLPDARVDAEMLARAFDGVASVETTLRLEDGEAVARRER